MANKISLLAMVVTISYYAYHWSVDGLTPMEIVIMNVCGFISAYIVKLLTDGIRAIIKSRK